MNLLKFILCCILLFVILSCVKRDSEKNSVEDLERVLGIGYYEPKIADVNISEISNISNVQIPKDAKIINVGYINALDDMLLVKFVIKANSMDSFISKSPFRYENLSTKENFCSDPGDITWWDVSKVKNYLSGFTRFDGKTTKILINKYGSNELVIYLQTY